MFLEKCKTTRQLGQCLSSVYAAGSLLAPLLPHSKKLWGVVVKVVWQVAGCVDNFQVDRSLPFVLANKNEEVATVVLSLLPSQWVISGRNLSVYTI